MRALVVLAIFCLLSTSVMAGLEIDKIRVYVDDIIDGSADEDGGEISVNKGSDVEFSIRLDNNRVNTTKVKIIGVLEAIENDDDIEKKHDWFEIAAYDDKTKSLSYNIPEDARLGDYDYELIIYYNETGGSEGNTKIDFTVDVEEKEEEEAVKEVIMTEINNDIQTLSSKIQNLSTECFGELNEALPYYDKYASCFADLSICNEYKKGNQEEKKRADDCEKSLTNLEGLKNNCESAKSGITQQLGTCQEEKTDVESNRTLLWIGLFIFLGATIFMYFKYVKKISKRDEDPAVATDTRGPEVM